MKIHRQTWLAMLATLAIFALLNGHCWRPGIGRRHDHVNGDRAVRTELELYYGWPACYRAELLRSDEPTLFDRMLERAPFFFPPYNEMWVVSRYLGWFALALNTSFALLATVVVVLFFEWNRQHRWS